MSPPHILSAFAPPPPVLESCAVRCTPLPLLSFVVLLPFLVGCVLRLFCLLSRARSARQGKKSDKVREREEEEGEWGRGEEKAMQTQRKYVILSAPFRSAPDTKKECTDKATTTIVATTPLPQAQHSTKQRKHMHHQGTRACTPAPDTCARCHAHAHQTHTHAILHECQGHLQSDFRINTNNNKNSSNCNTNNRN